MNSSFFITLFVIIILICCFFLPFYEVYPEHFPNENTLTHEPIPPFSISSDAIWPVPGYTKITSPFGKRNSPTARCFFLSSRN